LGNLEVQILGITRTAEDIPGWMIPEIYFEFLRTGDPLPLKNVVYHNAMDVLSLGSLFVHSSWILADPLDGKIQESTDLIAMAKLFENIGDLDMAIKLYHRGIDGQAPEDIIINALSRLASIYKHRGEYEQAEICWQSAASHHDVSAFIELAKYYEHHVQDYDRALHWTSSALRLIQKSHQNSYEQNAWEKELSHRFERISRKSQASSGRKKRDEHD
jgi:tetratricopeptide (TPR) repeat protein